MVALLYVFLGSISFCVFVSRLLSAVEGKMGGAPWGWYGKEECTRPVVPKHI